MPGLAPAADPTLQGVAAGPLSARWPHPRVQAGAASRGTSCPFHSWDTQGKTQDLLKPPFPHEKNKDDDTGDFPRFLLPPTPFLKDTRWLLAWSARIGPGPRAQSKP